MDAALSLALEKFVVLETGDERGEFAAMLLALLGAEVIKVEGRRGAESRRIGPFVHHAGHEQSLHFARYNLGKKSLRLDLEDPEVVEVRERLASLVDVIVDSGEAAAVDRRLKLYHAMRLLNPGIIVCTITPVGLTGPYRDLK
jgi:crotonobetainyl-CoA:carnitine CoA-transferase CaiB-like acyl-CoA transferase